MSSLVSNEIHAIFEDHTGVLWIGTKEKGLHQYDPLKDAFIRIDYAVDSRTSVLWSYQKDAGHSSGVTNIFEDLNGVLWIGDYGDGLYQFEPASQTFTSFRYDPQDPTSISDDDVVSIFEDRAGVLWVATNFGLSKTDRFAKRFRQYRNDPGNPNSLSYSHVWSVWVDHMGMLWAGTTEGGLNRIDRETGIVTNFRHRDEDPSSLAYDNINFSLRRPLGYAMGRYLWWWARPIRQEN